MLCTVMVEEELKTKEIVRTSLVSKVFIKKDSLITMKMLTQKRPGTGIPPKNIAVVVGSIAKRDIQEDERANSRHPRHHGNCLCR